MSVEMPRISQTMTAGESAIPSPMAPGATPSRPWLWTIGQGLLVAAMAVASYLALSHFILQSVKVVGCSMMPTLHDSERCLLNRWVYYLRSPQPGDVVVLHDPTDRTLAVKRVIAKSGDSVLLQGGRVYLNGQQLQESFLPPGTPTFPYLSLREQSFRCGPNQYLVLGDNRTDSADSRTYGLISRQDILGLIVQ
jgi:signal peptidase I